ncbi:MAG TPA: hypothetical protein VFC19_13765 [Candidatus Limnocylindrales bacterium]|nr:hypothetical protein [Candidatus Limnocylindrales bacterium]
MTVTAPLAEVIWRVEALEADRENLYGSVQMLDAECRETNRRQRADRKLTVALRTTQIEHGSKLDSLLVGQERLEDAQEKLQRSQDRLLDSYVHLERNVADMKKVQTRLAEDVSGLKTGQERLEQDVSGLKTGQARLEEKFDGLEGRFDGLEALVRKGFGMEPGN